MEAADRLSVGITGGNGFIAHHLAAALANKGVETSLLTREQHNLLTPHGYLDEFMSNNTAVVHTAAVNRGTDEEIIAGTVIPIYNLLQAAKVSKIRPKIIFLSSTQAETDTVYGKSKWLAEKMLEDCSRREGFKNSVFRIANVFGENGRPFYNSVIATFCHQAAKGEQFTVNPSKQTFNFVYVGDVVKRIIQEVAAKREENFFFERVISKNEISVPDLAQTIQSFSNVQNIDELKSQFHKDLYRTYCSYLKRK